MNSTAPTPAIPGRTIRIIVNKQRTISTSKSAHRVFNKSSYSEVKHQLHNDASFDSKMSKSTAFSSEASIMSATTQQRYSQQQSFGTTVKRFNANQDFKELFSRDPGPGCYSVISSTGGSVINGQMQFNTQGTGNGFVSKSDRFAIAGMTLSSDPKILVGPGSYEP